MSSSTQKVSIKEDKAKTLSNLEAQRLQALANNDSKTAGLIQRIINLLTKKK